MKPYFLSVSFLLLVSCGTGDGPNEANEEPDDITIEEATSRYLVDLRKITSCIETSWDLMSEEDQEELTRIRNEIAIHSKRMSNKKRDGVSFEEANTEFFDNANKALCEEREIIERYCDVTNWAYDPDGC